MKVNLIILLSLIFGIAFAQQKDQFITKDKAIDIANDDLGYGNTWIKVQLKNKQWQLYSPAIDDNPSIYFVMDAVNGNILLRVYKANDPVEEKKLKRFLRRIKREDYVEPEWVTCVSKILHGVASVFIRF